MMMSPIKTIGKVIRKSANVSTAINKERRISLTNDEEPSPTTKPQVTVHGLIDAGLDIPREHGSGNARGSKDATSLVDLMVSVPGANHEVKTRPACRFNEAHHKSQSIYLLHSLALVDEQDEDTPQKFGCGQIPPRRDFGQQDLRGNLAADVADLKECSKPVQLVAVQVEILLHSRNVGIVDVVPVEILGEEGQTTECQNGKVQFLNKLLFLFGRAWSRPEEEPLAGLFVNHDIPGRDI